jgi:single-stranded-DNA-specific exonuclease
MVKKWQILKPDIEAVKKMSQHLPCHAITAAVLINRNLTSAQQAIRFLKSSLDMIRPPFGLRDMDAAVSRIYRAIAQNENILIFGDYDVDGVTATAVILEFFKHIGSTRVSYYIPHRIKEGYSLQPHHIHSHARPNQIQLIITADCGSGSHAAIAAARQSGIDVIVTDHHTVFEKIPPAAAFLNPKRLDCFSGMEALSGVGVAFALIIALRKYLREQNFWQRIPEPNLKNLCDLVALGTIGDMVPLVDENRIFSKAGLDCINSLKRPGIRVLSEMAGISNRSTNAEDVAFKLVPRLNAAGRIAHAEAALQLLMADDIATARQLATSLNGFNSQRQKLERLILEDILADLEHQPQRLRSRTLVGWHPQWHPGVLGIVASRLTEIYYRPVVLVAIEGELGKGSARSVPGVDLFKALQACRHCLEDFGGHSMAAGLTIKAENLVEFQHAFDQAVTRMQPSDDQTPQLTIDAEMNFDDLTDELVDEIEALSPFGTGNPEPLFMARNVKVLSSKIVGKNHRKMVVRQDAGQTQKAISAICFNASNNILTETDFERIAFRLKWNRWNARKSIQLIIEDAS